MITKKAFIVYLLIIATVIITVNSGVTYELRNWLKIQIPNLDKVAHFFGMGILVFLALASFIKKEQNNALIKILPIVLLVIAFATAEEFSQKFLSYRSFQYWDLAANYLGILVFSSIFLYLKSKNISLLSLL